MSSPLPPASRNEVILAHTFLVFNQLCAIMVYTLGKKVMNYGLDVYTFVFLRLIFVVPIVFVGAMLLTRNFAAFKVTKKQMIPIAASGVLGILIGQSILFTGLQKSTSTNASIISAPCTPLFTALLSVLRGSDKMNVYKGIGFLSSIAGALILLEVENFEFKGTTIGNLMIVASSVCSAFNALIQKSVLNTGLHPLVVQTYVCLIGTIAFASGYAPFGLFDAEDYQMPSQIWLYAAMVGIVASALPWCVGIIALKSTSPMTTSVYVVLQPPLAAFVGVVLMGDALTGRQVLGSGLVLLGLVFVNANPIVQKALGLIRRHIFVNSKQQFELLPNAEDGHVDIEMKEMKEGEESSLVDEPDGAGATVENEVEYNLTIKGETNDFVIHDDDEAATSPHEFSTVDLGSERKGESERKGARAEESCNFVARVSGEFAPPRVEAISLRA